MTEFTGMDLIFLGTSSAQPTKNRNTSCLALKLDKRIWLFDCGEGAQRQMQNVSAVSPPKINKIFITHLHGDHCFGLPGLLCTIGASLPESSLAELVVDLYGPPGLRDFLRHSLGFTYSECAPQYRVHHLIPHNWDRGEIIEDDICIDDDGVWDVCCEGGMRVKAASLAHTVPCVGFVIQEDDKPGNLLVDKIKKEYGISPGPLFRRLKDGLDVVLEDGRVIRAAEVTGPSKAGRKLAILGDTSAPSDAMLKLIRDSDVLVHEATYYDDGKEDEIRDLAMSRGHSTAKMAGEVAREVDAKRLILNHFSPRYVDLKEKEDDVTLEDLKIQAQQEFSGDVMISTDFWRFSVPRSE